jgi:DNA-binding HxlR family transcriptional regulator
MIKFEKNNSKNRRPIMLLIDLLGRKWMMRIIWELNQEKCSFRNLQKRCGNISPTVLNNRMKELIAANIVTKARPNGYQLTDIGLELIELFQPLNSWVKKWEKTIS